MNTYNDYGFNDGTKYWSMGHQIRYDLNHIRVDVKTSIDKQTQVQTEDAEKMRTNQTTLFGNLIKTIKSIFGKSDAQGNITESFYQMVQRENDETQKFLEEQANQQKSSVDKLGGIITSLNAISKDIENDTTADASNTRLIENAIKNLKLIVNPYKQQMQP